jgi:hypothetical protein
MKHYSIYCKRDEYKTHKFSQEATASLLASIRKKQLLAANLVARNARLPGWRNHPVHKALRVLRFDMRMLSGVDHHHAVLVEQALIALHQDRQIASVFEVEPSAAI